jgi:Kdo2-lipid IVA lauroyltransferase/acyltransferase
LTSKQLKKLKNRFLGYTAKCVIFLVQFLSWSTAGRIGEWIGDLAFYLSGRYRRIALNNLTVGYPGKLSDTERYKLIHTMFRNLGRYAFESMTLPKLPKETIRKLVDTEDAEQQLQKSFQDGRSALIISAHYSNWELFAARLTMIRPLHVLARMSSDPWLKKALGKTRTALNVVEIDRDDPQAGRIIRKISKSGNLIFGILMDLDTRVRSIFSPFLNRTARTPSGPAAIALKNWFDVYAGFNHRLQNGTYVARIVGPLNIQKTGNPEMDIQRITDMFNELIGNQIMEDPTQWAWINRRWRHLPEESQNS